LRILPQRDSARMSGVVKIEWWELLDMSSPRRFVPVWIGLRL
jgi:hypothetical protein